jgi:hypothetical protein
MAGDAVDKAADIAGLDPDDCVTADLPIEPPATSDKNEQLHPDFPYTDRDVIRAVRDEMARTVEDVLARRTRVLFLDSKAATELAPKVGELMAKELGKDGAWSSTRSTAFEVSRKTTWWRVSVDLLAHLEAEYERFPFPLKHVHIATSKYFLKRAVSGGVGPLICPELFIILCQKLFPL